MCQHIWTCQHVLICADMCWHVPTCDIIFGPYDTNELDLICMLIYVSTCGHADMCRHVPICADMCWYVPTCVDMCQHVTLASLSAPLIPTSWTLSAPGRCQHMWKCRHVLICADMCWYMPTCANMWHHSGLLLYQSFGPDLHSSMCKHMWTCRHVSICADMCGHVQICANMWNHSLIPTIWTLSPLEVPPCADMCRHVPICANM